jgi:2,3,4,5-tetrahydropyridine-2-carboxylate N-succinyltransferase
MSLAESIAETLSQGSAASKNAARDLFTQLRNELAAGRIRVAEPDSASPTGWRVNVWVKQGILLGFRVGDVVDMGIGKGRSPFFDKDTLPLKTFGAANSVRLVPGGSSVRDGAYLGQGAVVVPGSRQVTVGAGREWGLSLATPVIVKYRDEETDARTELERWIR